MSGFPGEAELIYLFIFYKLESFQKISSWVDFLSCVEYKRRCKTIRRRGKYLENKNLVCTKILKPQKIKRYINLMNAQGLIKYFLRILTPADQQNHSPCFQSLNLQ